MQLLAQIAKELRRMTLREDPLSTRGFGGSEKELAAVCGFCKAVADLTAKGRSQRGGDGVEGGWRWVADGGRRRHSRERSRWLSCSQRGQMGARHEEAPSRDR